LPTVSLTGDDKEKVTDLVSSLSDLDDVVDVWSNLA